MAPFNLTTDNFTVWAGGLLGSRVQLNFDQVMNVANTVTVAADADGVLMLNNGMLTGGVISKNGIVDLNGPISTLGGVTLTNNRLVTGDGRISSVLSNTVNGEVEVNAGGNLTFTGSGDTSSGKINLFGGSVRFDQDLADNTGGLISGSGNLVVTGGLTNVGIVALSGGTSCIAGDVNNASGGTIIVSGNSTATFFDDMVQNGTEFRVSDGSSAVFFGSVSGASSFTGNGAVFFEGDLSPGNSPGLMDVEGDMSFVLGSHTFMEIGGLVRGAEYDAFDLGDGLFNPKLGDSFDLFSAESIGGNVDVLTLAVLGQGLGWQLDFLTDAAGTMDIARLSVVASTVPVPASVWLFAFGLLGLIGVSRRKSRQ